MIGATFLAQTVCLDDTTVKFEFLDTMGQGRYYLKHLGPMYYREAQVNRVDALRLLTK